MDKFYLLYQKNLSQLRIGQLFENLRRYYQSTSGSPDLFYLSDEDLCNLLESFIKESMQYK